MRQLTRVTLFSLLSTFFISSFIFAQTTGTVKGTLLDASTKEALIGASILLEGTTLGGATDVGGNFVISKVPAGTYTAVITYVGYKTTKIPNLTVEAGKITLVNSDIAPDDQTLEEVTVVGVRSSNTEVAVISEIKEAQQVVSGISAQQILKSQDRDAGEVVRRIPGVSVVDNRFINIRGLSDRYNTVWLNDVTAPSVETDRKSFSFDLIPSSLLDRVLVFKTVTPDLPGDFAGGLVKVYTRKPSFSERELSISYSAGMRAGTTFNPFTQDKKEGLDILGFGGKARNTPSGITPDPQTLTVPATQAQNFKNSYGLTNKTAIPDQRFSLSYLTGTKLGNYSLGSLTALNYSNTFTQFNIDRAYRGATGTAENIFKDVQSTNNVRLGALQQFVFSLGEIGKIEFRNIFNQISRNQVSIRDSYDGEGKTIVGKGYSMGYQARTTYNGQLEGDLNFNEGKTNLDIILGYALSNKNEPDLRRTGYQPSPTTTGAYQLIQTSGVDLINASRLYQKLKENIYTINAGVKQKFNLFSNEAELAAGTYIESKSRNFNAEIYGYSFSRKINTDTRQRIENLPIGEVFSSGNMATDAEGTNGFRVETQLDPAYKYSASNRLAAFYGMVTLPVTSKFKIITGVRYENNDQRLKSGAADIDYKTSKILPSANLSYNFSEKSLLRAAYGRSLNRPEFREVAPFPYYDFDFNVLTFGAASANINLDVADIDNYDLRYEYYPSEGENIHIGVFYKNFKNPIESVAFPVSSSIYYSFFNALSAYDIGAEIDIRKSLNFVDAWLGTKSFKNFSVLMNLSLIKSQVTTSGSPDRTGKTPGWSDSRPLQGQSPYVINSGIYYQSEPLGLQLSVLYNVFGPRVAYVGYRDGANKYPDIIEMPRNTIDITITKNFGSKFSINAGIADLLNQPYILLQDFNDNGKYERNTDPRLMTYRRGSYFTLGLKYNVF